MSILFGTNGRITADSISASDQPQIIMTPYTRSSTQYYNFQANSFLMNSSTSNVLFQPNYKIQCNGISNNISNTRILGKKGRSNIADYDTATVNSWPWDGTNDTWGSTDLTSVTPGEIVYFDCTIDGVISRIFTMAVSLNSSTLTAINLGAHTITGTAVKTITGYTDINYFGVPVNSIFEHNVYRGDLPTTTLNFGGFNYAYVSRIYGDNPNTYGYYQYNGSILDASLRGTGPSNRLLYSSGTAGTYTISRTDQGICINGTYYHDTSSRSRGTYPYLRIGLVLAGAGGGGSSGARSSSSSYRATLYGNGGGGGGVVCYVLDLLKYPTYTIIVGSGGAGGSQTTQSTRRSGSDGGGSSLYCANGTSSTYLVFTATGGKCGTNAGGGAGGGFSPGTYVNAAGTLKANAIGGKGGTGYYTWTDDEGGSETVNATAAGACSGTTYLTALSGTTNNSSEVTWSGAAGTFNSSYSGPGGGSIGAGGAGVYQINVGNAGSAGGGGSGGGAIMNSLGAKGGDGGDGYFYLYY